MPWSLVRIQDAPPIFTGPYPMKDCHSCHRSWEGSPGSQPGRNETCSKCGMDIHVCLNCSLYDPSASNQCRSRATEPVRDKDKRNFCDEFEFSTKEKGGGGGSPKGGIEDKWKDLFNH